MSPLRQKPGNVPDGDARQGEPGVGEGDPQVGDPTHAGVVGDPPPGKGDPPRATNLLRPAPEGSPGPDKGEPPDGACIKGDKGLTKPADSAGGLPLTGATGTGA